MPRTFGEYPPKLYRVFKKRQYALGLIDKGLVRLGELHVYRDIEENARRDQGEGESSYDYTDDVDTVTVDSSTGQIAGSSRQSGNVHAKGQIISPVYMYCCSYPPEGDESLLPAKFGGSVVRINDPLRFGQDLTDALNRQFSGSSPIVIKCIKVEYTKGTNLETKPLFSASFELTYSQKSAGFAEECEYRLVTININSEEDEPVDYLDVNLGKSLEYAELIIGRE